MCKCLQIARSTYYYETVTKPDETVLEEQITQIFHQNQDAYGTRKIKKELQKLGCQLSRRRIGRIMKKKGLVSKYTVAQFKPQKQKCNEEPIQNELQRQFTGQTPYAVVVSDLTYVRVNYKWNYVCILVDLFNREIIGYSAGSHRDAQLVYDAFATVKTDLRRIQMFHSDRGREFKNDLIDQVIETFQIKRSLSMKGCPYDNAVAEATFKIFKTEFVYGRNFNSLSQLRHELAQYIDWFNNTRIHGSLNYLTPAQFRQQTL
ncbi:IS3 family transposase ISClsp1 [bioreactor metagenome]|uniref:IS3 family transposase ISClsp1 n=1 Tax=bioreactor metagenome TaxID=1076179 RepID=A0A645DVJ4_9ZZZZ